MFGSYRIIAYLCNVESHQPLTQVKLVGVVFCIQLVYLLANMLDIVKPMQQVFPIYLSTTHSQIWLLD